MIASTYFIFNPPHHIPFPADEHEARRSIIALLRHFGCILVVNNFHRNELSNKSSCLYCVIVFLHLKQVVFYSMFIHQFISAARAWESKSKKCNLKDGLEVLDELWIQT